MAVQAGQGRRLTDAGAEVRAVAAIRGEADHQVATARLIAAGWSRAGVGDWAIALRSPSGRHTVRISPFDPAAPFSARFYRRAAPTGHVPRLELERPLGGGGHLMLMETLHPVDASAAARFWQRLREPELSLATLAGHLAEVHAEARAALPWCGPVDQNPTNVMRRDDGRLTIVDPFYADGPNLYAAVLSDPMRVARSIPAHQRRHMFDLPFGHTGPDVEALRRMRALMAAADAALTE